MEDEASAEHETSQLYKYYTFSLLSQLFFYQCYGISTAIDMLYEYKWSLLFCFFFTRHGGVNDVILSVGQTGLCFFYFYFILL